MYIAFFVIHENYSNINDMYINNFKEVIEKCANDNNFVHLFFSSSKNVHKFDKLFKQARVELFHDQSPYIDDIHSAYKLYTNYLSMTGYDYNWIIKIRPDILFFDKNLFVNIRDKYNSSMIHARARYYVGKKKLTKHQRSNWGNSFKVFPLERLKILDDQVYLIPFHYFPYAFSSNLQQKSNTTQTGIKDLNEVDSFYNLDINNMIDSPEKRQTLIWNKYEIPLNIVELYCVKLSDMKLYNLYL